MTALHKEFRIRAKDGTELFLQQWQSQKTAQAELVIVHGYAEYGSRYRDFAMYLADQQISTITVDVRGHGLSQGQRGYVEQFSDYYQDVEQALKLASRTPFLLGHSHGGLILLDYILATKPEIKGLILTNPFLGLAMPVPKIKVILGKLMGRIWPTLALPSGIDPRGVSRDLAIVQSYARDPMVFKVATARWFVESCAAQERVLTMKQLDAPLLYLYSDTDPIAKPSCSEQLSEQLQTIDKKVVLRRGALHELLNETDKLEVYQLISEWLRERT